MASYAAYVSMVTAESSQHEKSQDGKMSDYACRYEVTKGLRSRLALKTRFRHLTGSRRVCSRLAQDAVEACSRACRPLHRHHDSPCSELRSVHCHSTSEAKTKSVGMCMSRSRVNRTDGLRAQLAPKNHNMISDLIRSSRSPPGTGCS